MKNEMSSIIHNLENCNSGHPWYGRAVFELLEEINPGTVHKKPGNADHSLIEILYHMITWAEFTLRRLQGDKEADLEASEALDWREIDSSIHSWEKGVKEFRQIQSEIISLLKSKNDSLLDGKVDYRDYNYRFLINGMIQHNIYHIGQVAYLKKILS
jgi:uncharacterized damage-inducible protein DinB